MKLSGSDWKFFTFFPEKVQFWRRKWAKRHIHIKLQNSPPARTRRSVGSQQFGTRRAWLGRSGRTAGRTRPATKLAGSGRAAGRRRPSASLLGSGRAAGGTLRRKQVGSGRAAGWKGLQLPPQEAHLQRMAAATCPTKGMPSYSSTGTTSTLQIIILHMTRNPTKEHAKLACKGQPYKIHKRSSDSYKGLERMRWDNPTKDLHPTDFLCTCFCLKIKVTMKTWDKWQGLETSGIGIP